ncbi:MAG TPA: selenide, water dikinase SelD [Chitinophagales bacterium]|nr:selenide, water dikinase SelD [Chitinophagales bacterium]
MEAAIKLTQFSHGSGCGCKVAPAVLNQILKAVPAANDVPFKSILVGNETKDDAAVYDMGNGTALISTVDFFTPIVNNPFDYGRIAAANALSDVYAMGGAPFMAIAVLGFPVEKLQPEVAAQIIEGAKHVCSTAGVALAGGHTIDAPEPFFGLSVNGTVAIKNLKKNSTAQEGDLIYLTKPLGAGALATALKREIIKEDEMAHAINYMCSLNSLGAELGKHEFVHALTDVTGFGLVGHLIEMCEGANLSAEVEYSRVPLMDGVKELAAKFIYADNTMRNWKSYETKVQGINGESLLTLCDPQTSGGLLIALAPEKETELLKISDAAQTTIFKIGRFIEKKEKQLYIL